MFSTRRLFLAGLICTASLTSACAQSGPIDAHGRALEPLAIVTSTGEHRFMVEIADDDAKRAQGLMNRAPLADDRGMLFQFPESREQAFWMKNTPSPLDIIYINPQGRIVSISRHATPYSTAPIPSYGAANGVLELRAGRAEEIGAKPGDEVKHSFFKSNAH